MSFQCHAHQPYMSTPATPPDTAILILGNAIPHIFEPVVAGKRAFAAPGQRCFCTQQHSVPPATSCA
eukprot:CAMPEP_0174349060 /NCGR_PEP_ID=MMETSP0811_2-20130205/5708_1 /TAXON_ID=73025 ORGANISM="Eutreptiella gymnastica-like, Strain CCMP1594" /NCGR_SAMPLE_ID=MMETSP0811_2 /ASSEMBLY_ACC=CAM_ASM_000667 /LENGTH=66 /DNA_ID=CAMNT_0015476163 /DNA_START=708 /DNA_END=908 /DNA_ORIENTATION=+